MLRKNLFLFAVLSFAFYVSSCTSSNSEAGKNNRVGQSDSAEPCDNIITDAKINFFNQNSTQYQIKAAGYSRRCMTETIVNGEAVPMEVTGHTAISILPNLKFNSVKSVKDLYVLRLQLVLPTAAEITAIFFKLQISGNPSSYLALEKLMPAYLHFQMGALFKIIKASENESELKIEFKAQPAISNSALQSVNQLALGEKSVLVLWAPQNGILTQQSVGPSIKTITWSQNDTLALLQTLAADTGGVSNPLVLRDIITYANMWNVNLLDLHSRVPDLLPIAESQWEAPVITDQNATDLAFYLKYIVSQDFTSAKKPIFVAFEKLEKFQTSAKEALQTALDYSQGHMWTPEQFSLLVDTAHLLYPQFTKESWPWAKVLALTANYDHAGTALAAKIATSMKIRNFVIGLNNTDPIFVKISSGLNETNVDLYFQVFDSIRNTVKATAEETDLVGATFVMTGRLTADNKPQFIELFNWLEDSMSFSFQDSMQMLNILTATQALDANRTALFRRTYRWLSINVAYPKAESFAKMDQYFNILGISDSLYNQLTIEHAAFVKQGLPSLEALRSAETKVFIK